MTRVLTSRLNLVWLYAICLTLFLPNPKPAFSQVPKDDISGRWIGSFDVITPDGKTQHDTAYFILQQTGADLSGSAGSTEEHQSKIVSGKVDGKGAEFVIEARGSQQFVFQLTFVGDHLKGTAATHGHEKEMSATVDVERLTMADPTASGASTGLYAEIEKMDRELFQAFNDRDLDTMARIFDKDLEFYHDREGLTHYADNLEIFKRHFAEETRVRREMVAGTLQVFPLTGYGAVEFCTHRFYTTEKGKAEYLSATSRLVNLWRYEGAKWTLTRSISYDHR